MDQKEAIQYVHLIFLTEKKKKKGHAETYNLMIGYLKTLRKEMEN